MRYGFLLVPIMAALCLAGCVSAPPSVGELQSFSNACAKVNEGHVIAVEGYLRLPGLLPGSVDVDLRLYRDLTFLGKPIAVNVRFGEGPNQARKITAPYRDDELKVHLADGTLVPFGTKVRVSGRMYYPVLPQDFECGLENVYVEAAK